GLLVSQAGLAAPAPPAAPTGSPPSRQEARINALGLEFDEQTSAKNWDKAEALVREMAAIDPDHPKVYLRAVMLQKARGQTDRIDSFMDRLGPKDGPGRIYGEALFALMFGRIKEGTEGMSRALERYESMRHVAGQAACHTALGIAASQGRDFSAAARHFAAANGFLDQLGDRSGAADVLLSRADALLGDHKPSQAAESARRAVEIREDIRSPR